MAVRISSDASAIKRSANAPTQTAYTLAGWFYPVSATPARFWGPLGIYAGTDGVPTAGQYHQISAAASGSASLSLFFRDSGGSDRTVSLGTVTAGLWHFVALTCSSTAIGGLTAYLRAQHANALTSASNANVLIAFTPGRFEYGRDSFAGDFVDGAFAHCRTYDRALSAQELLRLSYDLLAEKDRNRANLNVYYRLRGANDIRDLSGNARDATFTPGIDWPSLRIWPRRRRTLASVSSTITGSLAKTLGAVTSAGAGAVDVSGALAKTLGTLTSTGTGAVNVDGTLAKTLGDATAVGTGTVQDPAAAIEGTLDKTLGALTSSGTGTVKVDGTAAVTLAPLTSSGLGAVTIEGSLAKTLGQLVAAGVGDNGDAAPPAGGDYHAWRRAGRR
jgi:hypothetical protein